MQAADAVIAVIGSKDLAASKNTLEMIKDHVIEDLCNGKKHLLVMRYPEKDASCEWNTLFHEDFEIESRDALGNPMSEKAKRFDWEQLCRSTIEKLIKDSNFARPKPIGDNEITEILQVRLLIDSEQ